MEDDYLYEIVTFHVNRGQKLEDLINASYTEKIFYTLAKEKYYIEESEKWESILGEGR